MGETTKEIRLAMIQFGDYRAAMDARAQDEPEVYRAQYASMAVVDELVEKGRCLVVCLDTEPYDEVRGNFRLIGGRFDPRSGGLRFQREARRSGVAIIKHLAQFSPSHVIVRAPGWVMEQIGGWVLTRNIPLLPLFADFFYTQGLKDRIKNFRVVRLLNDARITVVANHNYPACLSMVRAGVHARKVVPWDWVPVNRPEESPEKHLDTGDRPFRLFYAGAVSEDKGVGDLVEAVEYLTGEGMDISAEVCGGGAEMEGLSRLAETKGLGNAVVFRGMTPNREVLKKMRAAHLAVVPSRHEYPEGLPNVIYEGFETRTPLICSDHPTFVMRLKDGVGCRMFPARNPRALAQTIKAALSDPETYAALSSSTLEAWEGIQVPVTFDELLKDWVDSTWVNRPPAVLRHSLGESPLPGMR
jgi:glycosyltransferase involved in cell wall biosynthesis